MHDKGCNLVRLCFIDIIVPGTEHGLIIQDATPLAKEFAKTLPEPERIMHNEQI